MRPWIVLNNIHKDKLIIFNNIEEAIKRLKKLNVDDLDIYAYTSLNVYKMLDNLKEYGSLRKGKYAKLMVLDDNQVIDLIEG